MTNRNDAFRLTSLSDPPHGPSLTASCAYPRAAEVGCGTCLFPFARFVPTSGGGSGAGQWRGTSGTAAGCPRVRLGPRLHTVSPGTARGSPHAQWRGTSGTAAGCLGSVSDRGCMRSLRGTAGGHPHALVLPDAARGPGGGLGPGRPRGTLLRSQRSRATGGGALAEGHWRRQWGGGGKRRPAVRGARPALGAALAREDAGAPKTTCCS